MSWSQFDGGRTIGKLGSEGGVMLIDEEHDLGCRISLEKCTPSKFAITCGLYGNFVHTTFSDSERSARKLYLRMRHDLTLLISDWPLEDSSDDEYKAALRRAQAFVDKYR